MYVLYINQDNDIQQHYLSNEGECYNKIKELKCRWYKIYKEKDAKSNYFQSSFEWDYIKNDIKINIEKAKEIKRDEYRLMRTPILELLDIKYIRALEVNDQVNLQKVVELKEKLRNITTIELPNTEEELLYFYPDCFPECLNYLR